MRVSLQTYGGIAGGIRLPARSLDVAALGEDAAGKTTELAARAIQAHPRAGSSEPAPVRPDEMSYVITVEEGGAATVLRARDTSMTKEFSELLAWLEALLVQKG